MCFCYPIPQSWVIAFIVLLSVLTTEAASDDIKNDKETIHLHALSSITNENNNSSSIQYDQLNNLRRPLINSKTNSQLMNFISSTQNHTRFLNSNSNSKTIDESALCNPKSLAAFEQYLKDMKKIYYKTGAESTCLPIHEKCGWPSISQQKQHPYQQQQQQQQQLANDSKEDVTGAKLPLFVLSVGLEGAGHHLWTQMFEPPIFDCVWTNSRHYDRDIGDGVPKTSVERLYKAIHGQIQLRARRRCRRIYDSEDSFPTGAIRQKGRVFMRPDIVNLQLLDGVLFDTKYLIILRNITDTAMSAVRRNFVTDIDLELRTVEHTLTYLESVMKGVPCHKTMLLHYEHFMADPQAFIEPLSSFLELDPPQKEAFTKRLQKRHGERVRRKPYKLTQYKECKGITDIKLCYDKIHAIMEEFFLSRRFMWPTFAANGFDYFD